MTRPLAQPLFTGVGVALVTLFDDDGEVDAKATADHAAALVELGMRAVLVAGSTGRAVTDPGDRRDRCSVAPAGGCADPDRGRKRG